MSRKHQVVVELGPLQLAEQWDSRARARVQSLARSDLPSWQGASWPSDPRSWQSSWTSHSFCSREVDGKREDSRAFPGPDAS
jgi:hypothetical protein